MIQHQTFSGQVVSVGQTLQQGGPGGCYLIDSVVLKGDEGTILHLREAVVPGTIHWLLEIGERGSFDILHVRYPKPFGSYLRCFLSVARTKRATVDGTADVHKWISASRGGALLYFWYGLIFMPAFGMGLFFWLCAVRLLNVERPSTIDGNS